MSTPAAAAAPATEQNDAAADQKKKASGPLEAVSKTHTRNQITVPDAFDVVFGRGKPFQVHPGNQRLHRIVSLHRDRYQAARRYDKLAIAEEIVDSIKTGGKTPGRFLRRVEGEELWEVVPDDVAREKVAHALRGKGKPSDGHEEGSPRKRTASDLGASFSSSSHMAETFPPSSQQREAMAAIGQGNALSFPSHVAFAGSPSLQFANSPSAATGGMPPSWMMAGGVPGNWGWPPSISSLLAAEQRQLMQQNNNSNLGMRNLGVGMVDTRDVLRQQLSSAIATQSSSVPSRMLEGMGIGSLMPNPASPSRNSNLASFMMNTAATSAAARMSNAVPNTHSNLELARAVLAQERDIVNRRAAIERALRRDPPSGGASGAPDGDAAGGQDQPQFPRFRRL